MDEDEAMEGEDEGKEEGLIQVRAILSMSNFQKNQRLGTTDNNAPQVETQKSWLRIVTHISSSW